MTRPGADPRDGRNWAVVCGAEGCGVEWVGSINLEAVQLHFDTAHPGYEGPIAFETEWRGPGAAPVTPDNRAARRREEKRARRRTR